MFRLLSLPQRCTPEPANPLTDATPLGILAISDCSKAGTRVTGHIPPISGFHESPVATNHESRLSNSSFPPNLS